MDVIGQITAGGLLDGWGLLIIFVGSFLAGFVDAIAGGGGLISVPAFLFAGVPIHFTIGTNKLASAMGTALATFKYMRKGFMLAKLCVPCVIVALVASSIGANVSMLTSENALRVVMLIIIPLAGFYVLKKKDLGQHERLENFAKTLVEVSKNKQLILAFTPDEYSEAISREFEPAIATYTRLRLDEQESEVMKEVEYRG